MTNDAFVAFAVGIAVGFVLGIIAYAFTTAFRNNRDSNEYKIYQVPQPSKLQNIDAALEYYVKLRCQEPYGSENYNKLTEDINRLRYERDVEIAKLTRL